jgi:molybdopterin-dependent oxidoreductase alpha subunit
MKNVHIQTEMPSLDRDASADRPEVAASDVPSGRDALSAADALRPDDARGFGTLRRMWRWIALHSPQGVLTGGKPRTFREMLAVVWENRRSLPYAWRILTRGVCDGCSLGPRGLRDDVIPGVHLCLTRLKLLRLNTMAAMPDGAWTDVARLRCMGNEALHHLGRVPYPLRRDRGDAGFRRVSWDEALDLIAERAMRSDPARLGLFATSRGLTNETYYMAQRWMRYAGSNNVDSCARLCHAASVVGLAQTIGVGAPTVSLKDVIGTDLVILWGSNVANNQPVMTKYLYYAKKAGTRVLVVNPYLEEGLVRYWVPSIASSALFGTKILDEFYAVRPSGDIAFVCGVLKALLSRADGVDHAFIDAHTVGWNELAASIRELSWERLECASGLPRAQMEAFAERYARARTAVIVYSMGLTQHTHGVDNVKALVNLILARGMIGRERAGLLPIRGHSGVQGGPECGLDPAKAPGSRPLTEETAAEMTRLWGFDVPATHGFHTARMLHAARAGALDMLYTIGGNLYETMPDPNAVAEAFARIPLRVHQDIVLNTSALIDPAETVLVLPAKTRYEQDGGGTSTSTERRVRFSPQVRATAVGEARAEWKIFDDLGEVMNRKGFRKRWTRLATGQAVREEMSRAIPIYSGIERLREAGDWVQWGGPMLCAGGEFDRMPGSRAKFTVLPLPDREVPPGMYTLLTRRGKQFNTITYGQHDPLTGARTRSTVLLHPRDMRREGLADGDAVRVVSTHGTLCARVREGGARPGSVQAFWPEANVLLDERLDPESFEPDYTTIVRIERDGGSPQRFEV